MTLNGVMAVALRYFSDFGKPAFQHNGVDHVTEFMYESIVFCSVCTLYDVVRKEVYVRYLIS